MTTWVFEGTVLPAGDTARLEFGGAGDTDVLPGHFPEVGADGPIRGSVVGPTYELELIRAMVATAHARGARVAAHVTSELVSDLIEAGIDSVEHGPSLTEQDLQALASPAAVVLHHRRLR